MSTSLIVSTGAVYRYTAPMVKNLLSWWQIFEVLHTVAATKKCKAIAFTCMWR